ncbi:cytochrome P450 [Mycena crocata]|nr:cytochrome P450 [Mycena crocata]
MAAVHYLVLALVLGFALMRFKFRKARNGLPPGPPGLPFIGNALQIPFETPWVTYYEWAKQYGEIIHISVMGQSIIFLSSPQAVADLLDGRSLMYSDRPKLVFCGDLVGYKDSLPLCEYGDGFRAQRKLISEALGPRNASSWRALQERKVAGFLKDLVLTPHLFRKHIQRVVAGISLELSHGYTVRRQEDPMLSLAEQADLNFAQAVAPGAYLCDVLPLLQYIPDWTGVKFKQDARKFRTTMEAVRDGPYNSVKGQVARGTAKPSLTASLIEHDDKPSPQKEMIYRWSSTSMWTASVETTLSAIESFFLAMSLYPDIQRKAQVELDGVIGIGSIPTFEDRSNLPYLNAVVTEVYRWNPATPLAIPHRCNQEDTYKGFRIPDGSIIFANSWGIMHDEAIYPSPMQFKPERFLDPGNESYGLNPNPRKFAFGYGRRVCPGKDLADDAVFIFAAMTLAMFNIRTNKSTTKIGYTSSLLSHPQPFACDIVPRSQAMKAFILRSTVDE